MLKPSHAKLLSRRLRATLQNRLLTTTTASPPAKPHRSLLYVPASNVRAMNKARSLPADTIIFDLEDAVSPTQKQTARDNLCRQLSSSNDASDYRPRTLLVRINSLDTPWGEDDVKTITRTLPERCFDGIVIPKTQSARDVDELCKLLNNNNDDDTPPPRPIWAMVETPVGVLNAPAIARHENVTGLILGTQDLSAELNCRSRGGLTTALQSCVLAAKAHGITCVDGVYPSFRDDAGFKRDCLESRDWGFDGKSVIHPNQLAIANEVYAPREEEVVAARRLVEAFEAATARGEGVAVVDDVLVEELHVRSAKKVLEMVEVIAGRG
mmetsp:Transcript_26561/g.32159  ORF Transcript_26561/g.32159 Transcript_26561/m.32159 type:complete len:325 (-) Transcript_26561:194-1168(-)|eukprot:CAMPEP_0172510268 /NCGR_PEP_ID=MMETSP1066-20121228/227516_1 /TAXON_ID=671091 /ORGANISM="Coscinodiscus wailesii, Strain CCMP2513" /LENGTH=324 /DNA_ID=CAMNT_0013289161 /DNA_START=176 /DNA_END=1150 /DNA_ORIENTATION=-